MDRATSQRPAASARMLGSLRLVPLVSLAMISGSFAGTLTHEVIGHGLTGILLGYDFYAFYVSPFGTSEAYLDLRGAAGWKEGLVSAGGIFSDILLGLLVFSLFRVVRQYTPKFLLFFWAEDSLIGGSTYLAASSVASLMTGVPNGDPYWIAHYLNIPLEALALGGIALTFVFYYFLFKNLTLLLSDRLTYLDRNDMLASVTTVWLLGMLPLRLISIGLEGEAVAKLVRLFFSAAAILLAGNFATMRTKFVPTVATKYFERRQIIAMGLVATIATATWLGAFGPTSDTAHGVMIQEFPYFVNVRIILWGNLTADVQLAFRPGPFEDAWANLRNGSPKWNLYLEESVEFMKNMFGTNDSQLLDYGTDNGSFWHSGVWHPGGARVVHMRVPELRVERTAFDEMLLILSDPWKPSGFIDGLNVTLRGLHLRSSTPATRVSYSETAESGAWLNNSTDTSPSEYSLLLVEVPPKG